MNGEMHQAICIVTATKRALKDQTTISYAPMKYEDRIAFRFLTKKHVFKRSVYTAENVSQWFAYCQKKKLREVIFLCPTTVEDQHILGFSNTSSCSILCTYENHNVTYFTPDWQFDSTRNVWNVLYTEYEWINPPSEKLHFENTEDAFKSVLKEIRDLALRIECDGFAKIFEKCVHILGGVDNNQITGYEPNTPTIPLEYRNIYNAACIADVFGAMGSWNDSPPYMAHEKGLDSEYEKLSKELLKNIRLALLYAVNEW